MLAADQITNSEEICPTDRPVSLNSRAVDRVEEYEVVQKRVCVQDDGDSLDHWPSHGWRSAAAGRAGARDNRGGPRQRTP
jgi:hypothetical protein